MASEGHPATEKSAGKSRGAKSAGHFGVLPSLLGYNLRRAQIHVFQDFADTVGRHNITPGQFGVLTIIGANPGLNQSELGSAMGVDRSTVVAVIDRLENRNLMIRGPSPQDRRSYALRLSEQGETMLSELTPLVRDHDRAAAGCLSDEEMETLVDLLRRLSES